MGSELSENFCLSAESVDESVLEDAVSRFLERVFHGGKALFEVQNSQALQQCLDILSQFDVIPEPIYDANINVIAYESLARIKNPRHENVMNISDFSSAFYEAGQHKLFDIFTSELGLFFAKKRQKLPVTLNVSVDSILSDKYWEAILDVMDSLHIDSQDVIFEILEHDVDLDADISHLQRLKAAGYRFALDDVSIGQDHENRLAVFGEIADFVKLDGPVVRALFGDKFLDNGDPVPWTSEQAEALLFSLNANRFIIAEYVKNPMEVGALSKVGISAFQGRGLPSARALTYRSSCPFPPRNSHISIPYSGVVNQSSKEELNVA